MKPGNILIAVTILLIVLAGIFYVSSQDEELVGGERDAKGCLTAAGYSFNDDIGACVREFELTGDTRRAAQVAVDEVGERYALTVVAVETNECEGCFVVSLESGAERTRQEVPLSNWQVPQPYEIQLFYYDPVKDQDETGNVMCTREGLAPVTRTIRSGNPIEDTLNLLLEGNLTAEERDAGITTEFPLSGVRLIDAALMDGILTLTFEDPQNRTSGGACRAGILWFQIEETALQFPEVEEVRFMPEELFQP